MDQSSPVKKDVKPINKPPNFNSDLIFFKNEILGDLKQLENRILKKMEQKADSSEKRIVQIETSIDALTKKIFNVSNFFNENATMKDKIDNLSQARTKMEETIYSHEYKLSSIAKDLVTAINKYDRIIEQSIFYPGLIGSSNAKFNNFHNFIDFVMLNISQLNYFKDKTMGIDLKQYKNKLETTIDSFKKQTEEIITNNKTYTSKLIKNLDSKFQNDFSLIDQRLFNLKIKNTEQIMGIEKLTKNLINELNGLTEMKKNIEKSYTTSTDVLRWHYIYAENKMNEVIKNYDEIKIRIDLIIEALKGMKDGTIPNLPEILKNFENLADIKKDSNKKIKAESLLKKYIIGQINMAQITQLSRKNTNKVSFSEKSIIKSNIFDDNVKSNGYRKTKTFSRMNTRSFVKNDYINDFNLNRDYHSSEVKPNNINIFSSQRINFSNKLNDLAGKLSNGSNNKYQSFNNSEFNDKKKAYKRMGTTFFSEKKINALKNNKNMFDENISLEEDTPKKSSLWSKIPKNIFNGIKIGIGNIIKESASEYNNEFNKKENESIDEENEQKEPKYKKINGKSNIKKSQTKEKKNKILNEQENIDKNIKNNNSIEKKDKNKNINESNKSPRTDKEDAISNLDNQTILSTITEHNILTPKGEENKEQKEESQKVKKEEKEVQKIEDIDYIKKNLEEKSNQSNLAIKNIKSAVNIKTKKAKFKDQVEEKEKNKIFEDNENSINIKKVNFNTNISNENYQNLKNVQFPLEKTFDESNNENNKNLIFELKNKTVEMKDDKGLDIVTINSSSKAQLHKLLNGDRNAYNSFKIINKAENVKIPKITNSEYENKKTRNNRNTNIPTTKSQTIKDFKSASSTNFFSNKNIKLKNDFKFDILGNVTENDLEDFLNNYGDYSDINNLYPLYDENFYDNNFNKNSKVHIVNIPSIPQSHRLNKDKKYSKEALKIIYALRKIRYENDNVINSNKRKINRSNENLRVEQQLRKLKMNNYNNNKFIRTFEGFNM